MEKYTMFMDWKNQYSKNEYTTQSNLQIQCNPYQATTVFFRELKQIISQFIWKYKKLRIAKAILRKKNGTGGINLPDSSISLHCSLKQTFLSLLAILWNSAFRWIYLSYTLLPLASVVFQAICKASSDNHLPFCISFPWGQF